MVVLLALALIVGGPAESPFHVYVSVDQSANLSPLQLQLAIDEVRKIWREAGVTISSGRYGEPHLGVGEATISLRILLASLPVVNDADRILAWVTPAKQGGTAPLLFVSWPAVVEMVSGAVALDRPVASLTKALRDRLIARALGRVAAHELGHYLLQNASHETNGLMRPQYSANDLVGDWLGPFKVPDAQQRIVWRGIEALARVQASDVQ